VRTRVEVEAEQRQAYEELKVLALQIEAASRDINKLETILRQELNLADTSAADRRLVAECSIVKMDEYQFVRAEAERCVDVVTHTKQALSNTVKKLDDRTRRRTVVEDRYRSLQKELDICENNVVEFSR
jgi:hypothetical protein